MRFAKFSITKRTCRDRILADVNVLVYAFDMSAKHHGICSEWFGATLGGGDQFALVDTVLAGFVRIVTHPKIFEDPAPTADAIAFVDAVIDAPASGWVSSTRAVWRRFSAIAASDSAVHGVMAPDAYLAAVALTHGARFATADRGFARFEGVKWFDPTVV